MAKERDTPSSEDYKLMNVFTVELAIGEDAC